MSSRVAASSSATRTRAGPSSSSTEPPLGPPATSAASAARSIVDSRLDASPRSLSGSGGEGVIRCVSFFGPRAGVYTIPESGRHVYFDLLEDAHRHPTIISLSGPPPGPSVPARRFRSRDRPTFLFVHEHRLVEQLGLLVGLRKRRV